MTEPEKDHLPSYSIRPRFKIETAYSVEDLGEKIKMGLNQENAPCKGQVYPGYSTLYLPREEQHYWSPQLTLTFEETENGSLLRGLYAPRPAVWTMFVFFYSAIGFAILLVAVIGLSYLSLGKSATLLWLIPVFVVLFLTLYLVAYFGQKMGRDQMITLHRFVEKSTGLTI
ncbi:hypothetical protein QQ008_25090 [Fulvivirgaceae bacterium BMA10]|uniref:GTP-binding protein n=1 Tax=Splendidivirga corallicola TaxID=3051826 RepID=A0ABT8KV83_9BACT|nr:hypothetical protein [Fulvivirgaceae bacterium BMA10]